MQHPFAGILEPTPSADTTVSGPAGQNTAASRLDSSRRSFLGRALAAAAGVVGLGFVAAQRAAVGSASPSTGSVGGDAALSDAEAVGRVEVVQYTISPPGESSITHWPRQHYGDRRATTYALGEESGGYRPPPARYTTYALGEESGYRRPPYGGSYHRYRPAPPTTQALGEEAGYRPRPPYGGGYGGYRPAPVTTYAMGEEAGGGWRW